jgi:hypothetical protein
MESGKAKIRAFFESHVNEIVNTHAVRTAARIADYAKRIRELRAEGMEILSGLSAPDRLRPDEYLYTGRRTPAASRPSAAPSPTTQRPTW